MFISFEHIVSSDRSRYSLGIWTIETIYLGSWVPCKVKTLALYGLIFTVFDYGFIWFYFYLDFVAQNTIKKAASWLVIELKA